MAILHQNMKNGLLFCTYMCVSNTPCSSSIYKNKYSVAKMILPNFCCDITWQWYTT